ncbi:flavin monoamine oxidase family protein [Brevibacterium sp. CFH 10365]|uniref:flavin monoamine oxidase family protein n=1 Tax=Brevibacterium sp. CFH 10365 TaxID=2585207 RepID=UPI002226C89F|nr:NAD(P)/FAD-dependent oxidoreductase [Brevibacterium sp. CFH 10365]
MDADVVVVGAGLAGLQCARRLQRNGLTVQIFESSDGVGGRVRTDRIDGFLCDRGFQLLNPAYPAVRSFIDVPSLDLQAFGAGVMVRKGQRLTTLRASLNQLGTEVSALSSGMLRPKEIRGLLRWLGPTLLRPSSASRATRDSTLADSLDAARVTGALRRDVIDTFLAGVLADSTGASSANYARLLMRSFVGAIPGLPRNGMAALPEQMAASLESQVHLNTAVRDLRETDNSVEVDTGKGRIRARFAVTAVGAEDLEELTGEKTPSTRGLTTWWFQAPEPPLEDPLLVLDASAPRGGPDGPVWHTAVVSNAAPSYAPVGSALIQATTLLDRPDGLADEREVRQHLERIYATSTRQWQVLINHQLPHALPASAPPLIDRSVQRISERMFVCGDHRDTGSIQGALVSGDRAAQGVAGILAPAPRRSNNEPIVKR